MRGSRVIKTDNIRILEFYRHRDLYWRVFCVVKRVDYERFDLEPGGCVCGTRNKVKREGRSTALCPLFSNDSLTTKNSEPLPPPPRSLLVNLVFPSLPLLLPVAIKKESSSILFRICKYPPSRALFQTKIQHIPCKGPIDLYFVLTGPHTQKLLSGSFSSLIPYGDWFQSWLIPS